MILTADVRSLTPTKLNEVGNESLFGAFFYLKSLKFEKFSRNIYQKTRIKPIGEPSLSLTVKPIRMVLNILTSFSKMDKNLVKNYGKCD